MRRRPWHRWRIVWTSEDVQVESFHTFRWFVNQCASFSPDWLATSVERLS